jgi:hypothetical protein
MTIPVLKVWWRTCTNQLVLYVRPYWDHLCSFCLLYNSCIHLYHLYNSVCPMSSIFTCRIFWNLTWSIMLLMNTYLRIEHCFIDLDKMVRKEYFFYSLGFCISLILWSQVHDFCQDLATPETIFRFKWLSQVSALDHLMHEWHHMFWFLENLAGIIICLRVSMLLISAMCIN